MQKDLENLNIQRISRFSNESRDQAVDRPRFGFIVHIWNITHKFTVVREDRRSDSGNKVISK